MMDKPPRTLVKILHSVPHVNITFQYVNDTFNPDSKTYIESLGILASIPAALLILSLLGLLLYLLTRCCDRKQRKGSSQRCQNCTLVTITLLCCAAIGLGLYGNDDFHNGLLQTFSAGRKVENLVANLKKMTENMKNDLKNMKTLYDKLEETIDDSRYNQTAVTVILQVCRLVRQNTGDASTTLGGMASYFEENAELDLLGSILSKAEYESIRWPATLGFLTVLLLLCTILVIGVARRSRCALIFFSVFGLFGVIICWLLAGIYLSSSVALGDFCMRPNEFICQHVSMKSPPFFDCRKQINSFMIRLNQTKSFVEQTGESLNRVRRMARETHPTIEISHPLEHIDKELDQTKGKLSTLSTMLDLSTIHKDYETAIDGICDGGLLGLSLMMIAGLLTAFLLTILVYADSHAWIYLRKKQPEIDKSETTPLFPTPSTVSPTAPLTSGSSTINRTLLHHQQNHLPSSSTLSSGVGGSGIGAGSGHHKNGSVGLRGLAYSGDSPPPDYNVVVHGTRNSGHHTLGRLPSQQPSFLAGPNNGKYATLSKQCKTLESSDFY